MEALLAKVSSLRTKGSPALPCLSLLWWGGMAWLLGAFYLSSSVYFGSPIVCLTRSGISQIALDTHCWTQGRYEKLFRTCFETKSFVRPIRHFGNLSESGTQCFSLLGLGIYGHGGTGTVSSLLKGKVQILPPPGH